MQRPRPQGLVVGVTTVHPPFAHPLGMKIATWNLELARPHTSQAEAQQHWIDRIQADLWVFTATHPIFSLDAGYWSVISDPAPAETGDTGEGRWVQIWVRDLDMTDIRLSG